MVKVPDWRDDEEEREGRGRGGATSSSASLTTTQSPAHWAWDSWGLSGGCPVGPSDAVGVVVARGSSSAGAEESETVPSEALVEGVADMGSEVGGPDQAQRASSRHARRVREERFEGQHLAASRLPSSSSRLVAPATLAELEAASELSYADP